jgi:hypothetical protein
MAKKVSLATTPTKSPAKKAEMPSLDKWIKRRKKTPIPLITKRFTIDISADLHARIKSECALRGLKMNEVLRQVLENLFPPKPDNS